MKYFDIEKEFACKDGSQMPDEIKKNLTALVEDVMDGALERYGAAIHINSGYRTEAYNRKIGGAARSQHCRGQACDCCAVHKDFGCMMDWKAANLKIAKAIVNGGRWDQMILYVDKDDDLLPRFIHVSWKRDGQNRREIRKHVTGQSGYPLLSMAERLEVRG